jgi:hypothetical protein
MKGYIYKISSPNIDNIYIGSTIKSLHRRLSLHYTQPANTSKLILDAGDATIELIETIEYNDIKELRSKEREHISSNRDKCVNEKSRYSTSKEQKTEYTTLHKVEKAEYDKEYREKRKDIINKKEECKCGGSYIVRHRATHFKTDKHQQYMKE